MLSFKRNLTTLIAFAAAFLILYGCQQGGSGNGSDYEASTPQDKNDKVSYSIGYDIGSNFRQQSIDSLKLQQIMHGLQDGVQEADPAISDSAMGSLMKSFQKEVMAEQKKRQQNEAETNKKKADEFLAENKEKEDVQTTGSGLQYKILEEGSGPSPTSNDTVQVHYEGTLIDGTVFDSSYDRGEPVEFPVDGVIKGWTEALQMMKAGAKWKLFIPPELGYGERGTPGPIGPNDVLIFEVELLEVNPS